MSNADALGMVINMLAPFYHGSIHVMVGVEPNYGAINTMLNKMAINVFFGNAYALAAVLHHNQHAIDNQSLMRTYTIDDFVSDSVWNEWKQKVPGSLAHILAVPNIITPIFLPASLGPRDLGTCWPDVQIRVIDHHGNTCQFGQGRLCVQTNYTRVETDQVVEIDSNGHCHYIGRTDQIAYLGDKMVNCLDIENELMAMPNVRDCLVAFDTNNVLKVLVALWNNDQPLQTLHLSDNIGCIEYTENIPRTHKKSKLPMYQQS
jgi:acyl-coenzyme A synthetase/AMP-(fatty) acid ligase